MQQKANVVLFPEGTYVPGRVGPGRHRLIQMLLKVQERDGLGLLPFVPVGISYVPQPRGYEVAVRVGSPLSVPVAKQAFSLTKALMEQIAWLSRADETGAWRGTITLAGSSIQGGLL